MSTTPALEPDEPDVDVPDETARERQDEPVDDEATDDADPAARRARVEARTLRQRLRQAEAERDALTETLNGYRRREAEALAGEHLAAGPDLWAAGVDLAALLDDGGRVSGELVARAVAQVLADRPHWRRSPKPDPTMGSTSRDGGGAGVSWASVLRGR